MIDDNLYTDFQRVARQQIEKWGHSAVISREDLTQELCIHFLDRPNDLAHLQNMDDPDKKVRGLCNQIMSGLVTRFENDIFYSTDDVRGYLRDGMLTDPTKWVDSVQLDFCDGFESLQRRHSRYIDVLIQRYVDDEVIEDRKLVLRAVDALTEEMNRAHAQKGFEYDQGPGSRRVMSNSTAQAKTSNQWNG